MSAFTTIWLACGLASIYPYYRFVVKPPVRPHEPERRWRDLDPVFFPLVTVAIWPVALLSIVIVSLIRWDLRRLERQAGE